MCCSPPIGAFVHGRIVPLFVGLKFDCCLLSIAHNGYRISFFSFHSSSFLRKPDHHQLLGMAVQLSGTACIAVNQDSMYAVIEGSQSLGGDDGLFTLI